MFKNMFKFKILGYKVWEIILCIAIVSVLSVLGALTGKDILFNILVPSLVSCTMIKYTRETIWDAILHLKKKL